MITKAEFVLSVLRLIQGLLAPFSILAGLLFHYRTKPQEPFALCSGWITKRTLTHPWSTGHKQSSVFANFLAVAVLSKSSPGSMPGLN
jgi:hypothetical protein